MGIGKAAAWIAAAMLAQAAPAQARWITSWSMAPLPPSAAMGPFPATPAFENVTLRQTVRISAGGAKLRVRLTNAFGDRPLAIGAARVALLAADGSEVPGGSRWLSFGGARSGVVPMGSPFVSDEVDLAVPALAKLAISLYLPQATGPCTCHSVGLEATEVSAAGDFAAAPFTPAETSLARAFLGSVEVDAAADARTLVVLGDSISDGVGSTPGAQRRWPDRLAERLAARGGAAWGVANQGISGNRILNNWFGESALARLDRDVLALPGVSAVILFEGVNDLGMGFGKMAGPFAQMLSAKDKVSAPQVIQGYRQILDRAHARGIRVIGATIAPYKGALLWTPEGEAARQEINAFIRSGAFDGLIDFDAVIRDPADPAAMRADYHMGDHLHGNDAGYRAMGDAVDLALFD